MEAKTDYEKLNFDEGSMHFEVPMHFKIKIHLKQFFTNVGKGISQTFKKIEQEAARILKKIGEDAELIPLLAPLLIFKPIMVKKLNKLGVAHSNDIKDIAKKYHEHVVKGAHFERFHFNGVAANGFESVNHMDSGHWEHFDKMNADQGPDAGPSADPITAIAHVVEEILSFFKHHHETGEDREVQEAVERRLREGGEAAKGGGGAEAEAGVKGNLFGRKFDVAAFMKSPKKLIPVVMLIIGGILAIAYLRHEKK